MESFFKFDKMITPQIIKIVFWIGLVVSVLSGISMLFTGSNAGEGFISFLGLITIVVGPLIVRVYCELLIVIFKIHENLTEIKNK